MKIFYDRRLLFHVTQPEGCRYKCNFTVRLEDLSKGDLAVYSYFFNKNLGKKLKDRGVLLAFETAESPVHMQPLSEAEFTLVTFPILNGYLNEDGFFYNLHAMV